MAFLTEANVPLQAVVLQNAAGDLTAEVAGAYYFACNGLVFGPTTAGQDMADLTGLNVAGDSTAIYSFYVRPSIDATTFAITFNYEVEKSADVANGAYTPSLPFPFSTKEVKTNGVATFPLFAVNTTYLINQIVKFGTEFYKAKVGFVSGTSFVASDWTFVPILEIDTGRAIIGYMMLTNAQAASAVFVGGTTTLVTGGVTATYFPSTAFTLQ